MAGSAKEATDATFQNEVLGAQGLVMVDFWAPWCGPCRVLGPVVEQLAEEMKDSVTVFKVNVDENQNTSEAYRIQGIPALLFFHGGEKVGEMVGSAPKEVIRKQIQSIQSQVGAAGTASL